MVRMMTANDDYDYIIKVIQYLDRQFGIRFFINSKDFDVLYRWWEKRIPYAVVSESLRQVVERRLLKNKPITSFSVFSREVRLNYQSFLNLDVGRERSDRQEEHAEIKFFLKQFPEALDFLKSDFARLGAEYIQNSAALRGQTDQFRQDRRKIGAADAGPVYEKLLLHFQNDAELNAKCKWFLKNLAPDLRRPEIEKKYRLNYLLHKFAIPSFD
jgi:hypothetical protein